MSSHPITKAGPVRTLSSASDGGGDASPDAQRAAQELRERAAGLQRELNDTLKCCEDAERSASVAYDEVNRLRAENETLIRVGEDVRDRLADAAKSAGQDELVRALEAQRNSMLVQADATRSVAEQAKRELAAAREDEGVAKARLNAANDERRRLAAYVETLERRLGDQTTDGLATVAEAEALKRRNGGINSAKVKQEFYRRVSTTHPSWKEAATAAEVGAALDASIAAAGGNATAATGSEATCSEATGTGKRKSSSSRSSSNSTAAATGAQRRGCGACRAPRRTSSPRAASSTWATPSSTLRA